MWSFFPSLPVRGAWIEICQMSRHCLVPPRSLPVRGAWIEMPKASQLISLNTSLPVRGAWIEIAGGWRLWLAALSLPVRGAWIEILLQISIRKIWTSLPVRGAWIEIAAFGAQSVTMKLSLPVRGAWIETPRVAVLFCRNGSRSPCGERGLKCPLHEVVCRLDRVAPRAGSVD